MASYELTLKVDIPDNFGKFQVLEELVKNARDQAGVRLMEQILHNYEVERFKEEGLKKKDR